MNHNKRADGALVTCEGSGCDKRTPVTEQSRDGLPAPAGMVRRGLAALIDLAVVVVTLYALQAAVALSMTGSPPVEDRSADAVREGVVSLVVAVVYWAECWSRSGRTVGAAALGLCVVGPDGLPLRPAEAILRAVACVLLPLGLLSAVVDSRRRSLQDMAFGSRVVLGSSTASAQPLS